MTYTAAPDAARRIRLIVEFAALFLGVPLLLALALPPTAMFTVLGVMTTVGVILLHRTPGFAWSELSRGPVPWGAVAVVAGATALVSLAVVITLFPHALFSLPRRVPGLWLTIMVLYPLVSALPQELIFRPLFFRRYGTLFPDRRLAIGVNAALFSFAHVMYAHPVVLGMTFAGGLAFAWAYAVRGSFWGAVIMHAVAGQVLFTVGMGVLFYSGNVR